MKCNPELWRRLVEIAVDVTVEMWAELMQRRELNDTEDLRKGMLVSWFRVFTYCQNHWTTFVGFSDEQIRSRLQKESRTLTRDILAHFEPS
jgi:hypothetical protein